MSKINEKYPLADDIVNNLFDIAKYILELIEGQTQMKENEKKILLKKILNHVVQTASVSFTDDQKALLKSNIDSTVSLITIGWRSIESGKINIRPEEVISIFSCCFQWVSKCFKKSPVAVPVAAPAPAPVAAPVDAAPVAAAPVAVPVAAPALLVATPQPSEPIDVPVEIELEKEPTSALV